MDETNLIPFLIDLLFGGVIIWLFKRQGSLVVENQLKQIEKTFEDVSNQTYLNNQKQFLDLADYRLSNLIKQSDSQLEQKKEIIDVTLKGIKYDIKSLNENTIALKSQIEQSKRVTVELSRSTGELRKILSNSQKRGQWGERIVEDILKYIGLIEGMNYKKQNQTGVSRPDYTFFLPDNKILNMDVKFPLAHYERYIKSDSDIEKREEKKAFMQDVKNRIKEVSKKSYIDPDNGTLDYVLLFIPNESIYSFLNEEDNNLIDFSLKNKILLCSPMTLYAFLSLIRQAISNFAIEKKAGQIQKYVGVFKIQWIKFLEKINSLERSIVTLNNHFDELKGPRLRQVKKEMNKILNLELDNTNQV